MPLYQLSLIVRPLAKVDLVNVLKGCCTRIIEDGAVVTKLESLGYRDLPFEMKSPGKQRCITGSYFLFDMYAPESIMQRLTPYFKQNSDLLHYYTHEIKAAPPTVECTLHEELKPPAYRKSVEELRANKRMAPLSRALAVMKVRAISKREPKSYFIAPFRE